MTDIVFKQESYNIIGCCLEVHKALGHSFKEVVYTSALELEFQKEDIHFEKEKQFKIYYKNQLLRPTFRADFIVYESIILEIKATPYIGNPFVTQTINYLKASGLKLGIIINFGEPSLKFKRVLF
ncbi:MAG TPA: GxxExxY protein [Pedobacter sp.]